MYRAFFKSILDFFIALILLILCVPVMLPTLIILTFLTQGAPLFIQKRPGLNGQIFKIYKLKTMRDSRDKQGKLLPDAQRITWFGKLVRKASLDEIPQLINVFVGEMSIIGPRPLLVDYLPLYSVEQNKRHNVKPGITGWAQVNGRNSISWEQKFKLDVWYVDHLSLWLDLKILLLTIHKVIGRKNINQKGNATMEAFNGNN